MVPDARRWCPSYPRRPYPPALFQPAMLRFCACALSFLLFALVRGAFVIADDEANEITRPSEAALERGLAWLAKNQGSEGSWGSNDLGLVSMGALAFMSAGNAPGR